MKDQELNEQTVEVDVTSVSELLAPRILRLLNVVPVELAELLAEIEQQAKVEGQA